MQDDQILLRQDLDSQHHSAVDSILKDLQRISKRVKEVQHSLHEDLCVLQRLHYKGNNQHRAALFWKRTQEIRRILNRISDYDIGDLTESVARECHAHKLERRQLWRAAWTQLPAPKQLNYGCSRMSTLLLLLDKGVRTCEATYSILVLQIRAAAFLPVVLSLTSVVARVRALMAELDPLLRQAREAIHLLTKVHKQARIVQPKLKQNSPDHSGRQPPCQLGSIILSNTTTKVDSRRRSKQKKELGTPRDVGSRDEIDEIFGS